MNILIGNIVSLIASSVMVISGYVKSKKSTLSWSTLEAILFTITDIILGAFSGAVVNILSIPRNILILKGKINFPLKLFFSLTPAIISILFLHDGWLGMIPVIGMALFIMLADKLDGAKFKMLIIIVMLFWSFYDFCMKNYVSVFFDIAMIIAAIIAIARIQHDKKFEKDHCN